MDPRFQNEVVRRAPRVPVNPYVRPGTGGISEIVGGATGALGNQWTRARDTVNRLVNRNPYLAQPRNNFVGNAYNTVVNNPLHRLSKFKGIPTAVNTTGQVLKGAAKGLPTLGLGVVADYSADQLGNYIGDAMLSGAGIVVAPKGGKMGVLNKRTGKWRAEDDNPSRIPGIDLSPGSSDDYRRAVERYNKAVQTGEDGTKYDSTQGAGLDMEEIKKIAAANPYVPKDDNNNNNTSLRGNDLAPDGTGSTGTNMGWKGITAPMLTEEALLKSPYMRDKVINPLNAGNTTRPGFQQFTADKSIFDDADLGNLEAWNKGLDLGSAGASGSNARPGEWASSIDMGPGGAPDVGFGQDSMMLPSSLTGANTEAGVGGSWEDTPLGAEDMAWVQIADDAKRRRDIMLGGGHSMDLLNQLKYDKGYITRGGQHYKVGGDGTPVSEDVFRNDMGWGTGVAGMSPAAIDSENPKGLQTELGQAVGTAADWVEWNTDMPLDAEPIPYRPSGLYEWNTGMPLGASAIPYRPNY